jgi:tetratricopeptide (TPR) repeat protein/DNA-binding XRE family transcriptional regulator
LPSDRSWGFQGYSGGVPQAESFGIMLRRLRLAGGLTQERLAERAAISATGIAALESGRRRTPRLSTVGLLCDALNLDQHERTQLIEAAAGPMLVAASVDNPGLAVNGGGSDDRRHGFVGRVSELERLQTDWERRVRVVLIAGEAGIGKTRLSMSFSDGLADVVVLRGRCSQERLGAYEPFIEPIRAAAALRPSGDQPASGRSELGRLIPGLAHDGFDEIGPSRADPGVERRLLFEAIVALFAELGRTLLILDDLHWSDPGTRALLEFMAASPLLDDLTIVGTVRSTDLDATTASALSNLRRHCRFDRIELVGLNRSDLARLVDEVVGERAPDELQQAVADATGGNPLFAEELTEHLLQRPSFETGDLTAVPDGIRSTIEGRVEGLSPEAVGLLRCAAVLGRSFDPRVASMLADLDDAFLPAFEDALLSRLVVEQSATEAMFSHGVVYTTIYDSMSRIRRVDLHRRAATYLGSVAPGSEDSATVVDLARHWSAVAEADPAARTTAARWTVRAGDAAAASAAIDDAIALYERAVVLWTGSTAQHAETLIRLGSALAATGRRAEADTNLRAALHLADGANDAALFANAVLGLSANVRYGASDPEKIELLETAIARLGPDEMVIRPAALATLMRQLGFVETEEAIRRRGEAAEQVLAAVSAPDVSPALIMSLGMLRDSIPVDNPADLNRLARQILVEAAARRNLPALSTGWYRLAWSTLELGDANGYREAIDGYGNVARELDLPYELAMASNMRAGFAQLQGRYVDAEAAGQEALSLASTIEDGNFDAVYLANSVLRGLDTGVAPEMFELMTAVRADYVGIPTFLAGLALTASVAGEVDTVAQLLDEHAGEHGDFASVRRDAEWLPVIGFLAGACATSANVRHAATLRSLLLTALARTIRIGPIGAWFGPIDHHVGALSRLLGDLDEAVRRLESALVIEADFGARPFQARTANELALALASRDLPGDRQRADTFRAMAEAIAAELAAPGLRPAGRDVR